MDWSLPGSTLPHCLSALQHWTLLSPLDISTTEHHFPVGSAILFFLELLVIVLHCSPVAYWTPSNLRGSSSGTISFCLFILFMGFSRQKYWTGLPFPPPLDHILSDGRPVHLVWPYTTWLIASLNYASPFAMTSCDLWRENQVYSN